MFPSKSISDQAAPPTNQWCGLKHLTYANPDPNPGQKNYKIDFKQSFESQDKKYKSYLKIKDATFFSSDLMNIISIFF